MSTFIELTTNGLKCIYNTELIRRIEPLRQGGSYIHYEEEDWYAVAESPVEIEAIGLKVLRAAMTDDAEGI